MTFIQDVETKVGVWLLSKEFPIAVRAGAASVAGILTTGHTAGLLAHFGVTVDPVKFTGALVSVLSGAAVTGAFHLALSWVSHHLSLLRAK